MSFLDVGSNLLLLDKSENPTPAFRFFLTLFSSHMLHFLIPSTGNHQSNSEESRVARRMCVWIPNRLLPLLCCGLTCERLNIRRKSFFFSSSGVQSICSAEYGVVKGVVGVEDVEDEQAFFLPCTAGGETLRSFIILLLFLLF